MVEDQKLPMTWITYPDDKECPSYPNLMAFINQWIRENVPVGEEMGVGRGERMWADFQTILSPRTDWLLERDRCFECAGHGENSFDGDPCSTCLETGKQSVAVRLKGLEAFK